MPLSGMLISRIEDGENLRNAFEISGQYSLSLSVNRHSQHFYTLPFSLRRWPVRADAGGVHQSARSTGLAGPPHQTHTHSGDTLAQASVRLSHRKWVQPPNDVSIALSPTSPTSSLSSTSPSCPLIPALPQDCQRFAGGALDTLTTAYLTPHLAGPLPATIQCGGPWSHQAPPNPGA